MRTDLTTDPRTSLPTGARTGLRTETPTAAGTAAMTAAVGEVLAEALGRRHREDPALPRTGGPAGNARLTAWLGLVLLVLLVGELLTLLDVGRFVSWHVALGAALLPPALAKTAVTSWRVARYYGGAAPYRAAGPPVLLLRLIGPLVVLSTLGLIASGVTVGVLGPRRAEDPFLAALGQQVSWLTVHQAVFVVWCVVTGLHVLARLVPALRIVRPAAGTPRRDGGAGRLLVLVVTAAAAVLSAVVVLGLAGGWTGR